MRVEGPGKAKERRWLRPLLIGLVLFAGTVVPAVLYYTRGRHVPLRVVVHADRYVVPIGGRVALRARVDPVKASAAVVTWTGAKVSADKLRATLQAPTKIGLHTVTVTATISGTKVTDRVSIRVVPRELTRYRPLRPPRPLAPPPATVTPCGPQATGKSASTGASAGSGKASRPTAAKAKQPAASGGARRAAGKQTGPSGAGPASTNSEPPQKPRSASNIAATSGRQGPLVELLGSTCAGCTLVATLRAGIARDVDVWHRLRGVAGSARRGRVANLRVPAGAKAGSPIVVETVLLGHGEGGARCGRVLTRRLPVLPRPALIADFRWQLVGPGHFRLNARPPRGGSAKGARYTWNFRDGSKPRATPAPRTAHTFKGAARRYRVVTLEVHAGGKTATVSRVVIDRTAKER